MVIYKQFLALLLLPNQGNALLSPISPSTGLHHHHHHRPSSINVSSPPFLRYNTLSSSSSSSHHKQLKHDIHDIHHPNQFAGRATQQVLHSASSDISDDDTTNDDHTGVVPLSISMGVGIITAFIGYMYSKCMSKGLHLLWKTIPSMLFGISSSVGGGGIASSNKLCKLLHQYPAAYIVLITTLGGGLVATLSALYFPNLFNAHDYVHVLSDSKDERKMDAFPTARSTLLPMLFMSCVTSISGFSLGPEAPMVTAGGLVGVSLARKYLKSNSKSKKRSASVEETLAYAGAAGTLSGFMNVPLAGPIFAMEMTNRGTGVSSMAAKSWNAAMAACFAGMVFVRGGLVPNMGVGGHFTYGAKAAVGALTGREMVLASLTCGVGGAVVGTMFHKTLHFLKSVIYPSPKTSSSSSSTANDKPKKSTVITKKLLVAFAIGLISILYPQTMFWGEGTLQCVVDGQCTPLAATPHAIPAIMTAFARVDPNLPFAGVAAPLQVGMAKFVAIALAAAGGFPGGVIFPLLSNGALLSHALIAAVRPLLPLATSSLVAPLMVMSFMASTLTSITRTPLATVLILALSSSGMTPLSVLLPGVMMASYVSVWVSDRLSSDSFFSYSE